MKLKLMHFIEFLIQVIVLLFFDGFYFDIIKIFLFSSPNCVFMVFLLYPYRVNEQIQGGTFWSRGFNNQ